MKKTILGTFIDLLVCLLCAVATGIAGVPHMINFQGRLTDAQGDTLSGDYSVRFRIYADSSGATTLWEEYWLTTEDRPLQVSQGIFNVLLGGINPIPDTVFTGADRWLGMKVEGDPEMSPLQPIASVGYAFHSATSDTAEYAFNAPPDNDWDTDTSGFYIYRVIGGVGIGTTIPQSKLEVAGTAQMTGFKMPTGASSGYVLTSDASGVGTWQAAPGGIGGSGTANYIPKFTTGTTIGNSLIYEATGNVGVGTESPSSKLTVAGLIESTSDGVKFPDGTVQTTAAESGGYISSGEACAWFQIPDTIAVPANANTAICILSGSHPWEGKPYTIEVTITRTGKTSGDYTTTQGGIMEYTSLHWRNGNIIEVCYYNTPHGGQGCATCYFYK